MGQIKDTLFILGIVVVSLITVAYAAPTAGQKGVATITGTTITACQSGFYGGAAFPITADSCQVCNAGSYTAAANTATACTSCQAGYQCAAATYAAGATTGVAKASCAAGTFCATAGLASGTTCPNGHYCLAGATSATPCGPTTYIAGTGNDAASDCVAFTGTAITGCAVYETNTGTITCNIAADGYFLGAAAPTATVTPCLNNCGVCTGATYATCTTPKAGFFQDATTSTLIACAAGCKTCNAAAANSCTAALAGFYLDATAGVTACPNGKGAPDGNTGAATTCVDCNATASGLCGNCKAQGFCTTCKAGNVLTASTGVCTAFDQTTKHVTCLLAEGTTNADCNTCDATKFRTMEIDTTTSAAKAKGLCKCMDGYAEEATVVAACKACGTNVAACTFNSAGVETIVTCKATFTKLTIGGVTACVAPNLSGTDVTGFFWDTTGTTSQYVACNAGCKTCNGNGADKCILCPARATTWTAPTESEANYATYLTLITNINNTCFDKCPDGWEANETRDSCVAGGSGSASGIFAILLLIASLFILI